MIIHLNGWPGVGKRTIGEMLAARLGARFIHNHTLHDVAIACCGVDDPERWTLYEHVRSAAYEALLQRPRDETFVMTNALCEGSAREREAWDHVVALAKARDVPLVPVILEADLAENERRLQSTNRTGRKLTDPERLRRMIAADALLMPDMPGLLVLDVTRLTSGEAAVAIERHVRSQGR